MRYVIIPVNEITQKMINDSTQAPDLDYRKNNAGTKGILCYIGEKPASMSSYQDYSQEEIEAEILKAEWRLNMGE